MKKTILLTSILLSVSAYSFNRGVQPPYGGKWGEIRNFSAEEVISDDVCFWDRSSRGDGAECFYDYQAHDGEKSLCISSKSFAAGNWSTVVNVKPWAKYRFTGWVKTKDISGEGGVAFRIDGAVGNGGMKLIRGSWDWMPVNFEFETGSTDCVVLQCMFGEDGDVKGKAWFDDMSLTLVSQDKFTTSVKINPDYVTGKKMSQYIYGQFIEHLGRCIYGGIWAEMVMDRKFWYSPADNDSPWKVITSDGSDNVLDMDTENPYVGAHTPVLKSTRECKVSLVQSGIGMNRLIDARGYIVLKSDTQMPVTVSLSIDNEVHSITVNTTEKYEKYPVELAGFPVKSEDVTLAVTPKGEGRLWIGTVSLMPDDNIDGFRADVIKLLRELNAPVYRWPGGNFVSGYNWKDGIGPRDQRPPRKNPAWTGVESNDVGIHEFMRFCELVGTEPYIAVNAGLGGVKEAAEEVQYCCGAATTPMGRLRAENGTIGPWSVKWWSVGNEMYGDWQLGHMSTEDFVQKHNAFEAAMRAECPEINIIAVGCVGPWDEMIMDRCNEHMDLVSEHFYCGDRGGRLLMAHANQIPKEIKAKADAHRTYRKEIPSLAGKDIKICMDEWNYWYGPEIYGELGTRYFLKDALGIAAGLNEFLRNSDICFMANYAQTVNVIGAVKTTTTDACFAPTGEVLKTYREHFGTVPVHVSGETRPLDVAAAVNPKTGELTVSVINLTYDAAPLNLSFVDSSVKPKEKLDFKTRFVNFFKPRPKKVEVVSMEGARVYTITGPDDMAYNTPGQEPSVKCVESPIKSLKSIVVAPCSANIYVFKLSR